MFWRFKVKGNNVFANFLLDATIQDSIKKERSNCEIIYYRLVQEHLFFIMNELYINLDNL